MTAPALMLAPYRPSRGRVRARFGRTFLGEPRYGEAAIREAQETPRRPDYNETGISGTRLNTGFISGYETNEALTGREWAAQCELMLRADPQVSAINDAVMQTLLSATWRWKPVDTEASAAAADYLNECFGMAGKRGRLLGGWEAALANILGFIPVGYRYLEEVYEPRDGRVWLRKLADREPSAHMQWHSDPKTGELVSVEQQDITASGKSNLEPIPAHKLVLFTRRRTGQNYEGRGLLRSMHPWFLLKRHVYDLMAIGAERWTVPTPKVKVNLGAAASSGIEDAKVTEWTDAAKLQAKAYLSHQAGFLVENDVVTFDVFGGGAFDPSRAAAMIAVCDEQMAAAAMLGFLRLGVTDTGSRSVGEVLQTFFRRACINDLDTVCNTIGGPAGPGTGTAGRLLKWNFPSLPEAEYPALEHEGLNVSPLLELLPHLPGLVQGGLVDWQRRDQQALRQAATLDPLPDDVPESTGLDAMARVNPVGALATVMHRSVKP